MPAVIFNRPWADVNWAREPVLACCIVCCDWSISRIPHKSSPQSLHLALTGLSPLLPGCSVVWSDEKIESNSDHLPRPNTSSKLPSPYLNSIQMITVFLEVWKFHEAKQASHAHGMGYFPQVVFLFKSSSILISFFILPHLHSTLLSLSNPFISNKEVIFFRLTVYNS